MAANNSGAIEKRIQKMNFDNITTHYIDTTVNSPAMGFDNLDGDSKAKPESYYQFSSKSSKSDIAEGTVIEPEKCPR
jgi:hypothetical protein